jgi:hypothetical protein
VGDRILRIDGSDGERFEITDATPPDNPADWKPRWHLHADAGFSAGNHVEVSMELWDCEPTWLELFANELSRVCASGEGEAHLATGSLPDVSVRVVFEADTGEATVLLEIWDADQQLELRFLTDEIRLEATLADLGAALAD